MILEGSVMREDGGSNDGRKWRMNSMPLCGQIGEFLKMMPLYGNKKIYLVLFIAFTINIWASSRSCSDMNKYPVNTMEDQPPRTCTIN